MDESAEKPVATEENQVLWEFSESESWSIDEDEVTGKPVAYKKARRNLRLPVLGNPKAERRKWPHNFYISSAVLSHMDKLCSIVRKTFDGGPTDEMDDFNVNAAIWGMFMNTALQAAVHLGQDYDLNLRFVKYHFWSSLKSRTRRISMIDYEEHTWSATSLLCDKTTRSRKRKPTPSPTRCSVWEV